MSASYFRIPDNLVRDTKLTVLAKRTGYSKCTIMGFLIGVLCMANDSPIPGKLLLTEDMPVLPDEIFDELQINSSNGQDILNALVDFGYLAIDAESISVVDWDQWHPTSNYPSDWAETRKRILERDNRVCGYCGSHASHIDHIQPVSDGGTHYSQNLVASCTRCNTSKGNKNMIEWYKAQPFFDPKRLQNLFDVMHFQYDDNDPIFSQENNNGK